MPDTPQYEVLAIRYAENSAQRSSQNFLGGDVHDVAMPLDYFIWAIRGGGTTVVVDTGFDAAMAAIRKRTFLGCPANTLGHLGIDAATVPDVIITHLHYDHAGNHHLFPAARFHLQDREMAYATGRSMTHPSLRQPYEASDVAQMVHKVFAGRVQFHDGDAQILPGLSIHRVGGHTHGMQVVRVWTRRGWVVLASDASHFYANMEQQRSFPIVHNVADMLEGHARVRELADGPDHVIPGHDPLVMSRYPAVSGLESLAVRLDADPRPDSACRS